MCLLDEDEKILPKMVKSNNKQTTLQIVEQLTCEQTLG